MKNDYSRTLNLVINGWGVSGSSSSNASNLYNHSFDYRQNCTTQRSVTKES